MMPGPCFLTRTLRFAVLTASALASVSGYASAQPPGDGSIACGETVVEASASSGTYTIRLASNQALALRARAGVQVDHHWVYSDEYPQHTLAVSEVADGFGRAPQLAVTNHGRAGIPDLVYILRSHEQPAFCEIQVELRNISAKPVEVQTYRLLEVAGDPVVALGDNEAANRVLSDSFSEDRPNMRILDLFGPDQSVHRGVGIQLIYNRETKRSLFMGALTSDRWLTVLRLHADQAKSRVTAYDVDCTGTTELTTENSLQDSPSEDRIELSLAVAPGAALTSERLLLGFSSDYHRQLELYGELIRRLHHPRQIGPPPAGWWSWTAYYFGLTEGTAITNSEVLSGKLKDFGYDYFHIDEGYQFARGEYTTADTSKFPRGMGDLESHVRGLGLTPGIWTAPFEVSERSQVYRDHKDWLVRNLQGDPIHLGYVSRRHDRLYALDTTNPGAQQYLRQTYRMLSREWGIRYIKLDFMEDSAVEGVHYRRGTTALEAQRIGLQVIREAVGDGVLLDKDGSPMLNPVGLVDTGRISCDTGHALQASIDAAPGIAARYYMNRNYYVADPDAFTVSRQEVRDEDWHQGTHPLTLDEARISIALAAVAGGMYEIGDDLPTTFADEDRWALLHNRDLFNMARLGVSATPLDLMSYEPEDEMPSIFLLKESNRQSVLTVFNWTSRVRQHHFDPAGLGVTGGAVKLRDVFASDAPAQELSAIKDMTLQPHTVRVFKIVDTSMPPTAPRITSTIPTNAKAGEMTVLAARADPSDTPALHCRWDFGDGALGEGFTARHAYTHAGDFHVQLIVEGLDGIPFKQEATITVSGNIPTRFRPEQNRRGETD